MCKLSSWDTVAEVIISSWFREQIVTVKLTSTPKTIKVHVLYPKKRQAFSKSEKQL